MIDNTKIITLITIGHMNGSIEAYCMPKISNMFNLDIHKCYMSHNVCVSTFGDTTNKTHICNASKSYDCILRSFKYEIYNLDMCISSVVV